MSRYRCAHFTHAGLSSAASHHCCFAVTMMSAAAKFVLLSLALLALVCTGATAFPQSQPARDVEELRSALAMSQMILAQQAQLFRELINATRESHGCCNAGKSGEALCQGFVLRCVTLCRVGKELLPATPRGEHELIIRSYFICGNNCLYQEN